MTVHVPVRSPLDATALAQLFTEARTHNGFHEREVPEALLEQAVELAELGPTAANSVPMRVVFVRTKEGKEKLRPALSAGNLDKTMSAPVTAIVAYDVKFYERLPRLFPHAPDARHWFDYDEKVAEGAASMNGTLQGAYLILALRALGLDTGPMGGFDRAKVDQAFFPDGRVKSNFLINIGFGDGRNLYPRSPRLSVQEVSSFA